MLDVEDLAEIFEDFFCTSSADRVAVGFIVKKNCHNHHNGEQAEKKEKGAGLAGRDGKNIIQSNNQNKGED